MGKKFVSRIGTQQGWVQLHYEIRGEVEIDIRMRLGLEQEEVAFQQGQIDAEENRAVLVMLWKILADAPGFEDYVRYHYGVPCVKPNDLTRLFEKTLGLEGLTSRKVGAILKGIGLTSMRVRSGYRYVIDRKSLLRVSEAMGLDADEIRLYDTKVGGDDGLSVD